MSGVCKFCGCTENTPCLIDMADGTVACWWIAEDICSAPACVEKAYREAGAEVIPQGHEGTGLR